MGPMGVVVPVQRPGPRAPAAPAGLALALAVDAGIGVAGDAARLVRWSSRSVVRAASPVVTVVLMPPLAGVGRWPLQRLRGYAARGRIERIAVQNAVTELVLALVPPVTDAVLDRLDLTAIVRERVDLDAVVTDVDINQIAGSLDLDAIAAGIDVDAVAARLDVAKVIDGIDLATIARQVIDAIDLPEIVRESSGAMASDTVRGVRLRTVEADEQVSRVVDRLLGRHRPRPEPT
ncbi:MAG TPA: hypothetical protein VH857_00285 [Actinomycetes bacterium]|nr:hypothetical protein [Actinomycetes bacterium]